LADIHPIANDPVAGLIDVPLPQQVSLWPQTWESRVAVAALLVAAVIAVWQFVHHRRANRYRREALAELDRITHTPTANLSPNELAMQLSLLVRRTALAAFPREQVAPLAGSAWLAFLDRTGSETEFSSGVGRWLIRAPYAPMQPDEGQRTLLIDLTRRWIRGHHA
jgi:Ca-activated chloride channel family protein